VLVIINADDLGASAETNEAIFREIAAGRVTSATILANGPRFDGAVRDVRKFPQCSFGVHLNLTEYEPLTDLGRLRSRLKGGRELNFGLRYASFGLGELRAVYKELAAQVRRAKQAGIRVSHLDSHHHIHTRFDFLPLVKLLQHEFGILRVRARLNLYPLREPARPAVRLAIPLYNAWLRRLQRTRTTDCMARLAVFIEHLEAGWRPNFRSVELMVHPGLKEPNYQAECELLRGAWLSSLGPGVRLGSFWDL
jgi:hypothetical protein